MKQKILTIIGPTAIGKTAIAIEIAKQINGEVIGLDSRQIYFGMEIGTAQPTYKDIVGNAASVIIDLEFGTKEKITERYIDFYHMLKVKDKWFITSKIFPTNIKSE